MVKVLRPFHDGPSGRFVLPGDDIDPAPGRHDELAANGLVPPREPAVKMEAAPPVPPKRGPGRPAKAR